MSDKTTAIREHVGSATQKLPRLSEIADITKEQFKALIDSHTDAYLARLAGKMEALEERASGNYETPDIEASIVGTNGLIQYTKDSGEHPHDRERQERFWRSLGKKIRKGARV